MSDFNTKSKELDLFPVDEEFDESYIEDEEFNSSWIDTVNRDTAIEAAVVEFIDELIAVRASLAEQQQLSESFDQLNYNVAEQHQQIQTILRLLEPLTRSLSAENISKLSQIQKSFSTFSQKLEMFEKAINTNIRQQQESRTRGDETYQNLDRAWRRLADEIKEQRQIIGGIPSWENFAAISIGSGLSAALFTLLAFKFFMTK
jgi:DNA repair exonuclease SbcCD ATPase subunit